MPTKNNFLIHFDFRRLFRKEDLWLWLPVIALTVIGVLFIYSSSLNIDGTPHQEGFPKFAKQMIWIAIGFLLALFFILIPFRDYSTWIYYSSFVFIILMMIPIFLPSTTGHSWIRLGPLSLQPSELFKPFYIIVLSILFSRYQKYFHHFWGFLLLSVVSFIPIFITFAQRDMGTASVYLPVIVALMLRAGANKKFIWGVLSTLFLVYFFTVVGSLAYFRNHENFFSLLLVHPTARIVIPIICALLFLVSLIGFLVYKKGSFYWISFVFAILLAAYLGSFLTIPTTEKGFGVLGQYQIERIIYPVDSSLDLKTSYNIEQAKTAIGSGGFIGKGYLKGNLSHRQFVPEQPTDFIFSILGEEWGWLGSILVLLLYGFLLVRILFIGLKIQDLQASMVLIGLFWVFFYHMVVNIGMNLGMIPVIGIPLLFISYGGSSIIMAFISIGIIINLSRNY